MILLKNRCVVWYDAPYGPDNAVNEPEEILLNDIIEKLVRLNKATLTTNQSLKKKMQQSLISCFF